MQAISGDFRKEHRYFIPGKGSSPARWRTDFLGEHGTRSGGVEHRPQAFLAELDTNSRLLPHFHQVAQFQLMLAGSATLNGKAAPLLAMRYADRHTPCGPIDVGAQGLVVFMLRAQADPGALHLHKAENQQLLRPSPNRYVELSGIGLSTEPVLAARAGVAAEILIEAAPDGLGALMLRMGAAAKTIGPDPRVSAGQYYVVVNGSLQIQGTIHPCWSIVYLSSNDAPLEVHAGPSGVEVIVLNFPREP